jgi:hypothetical protein
LQDSGLELEGARSTSKESMSEISLAFELIYHTIGKKDERGKVEKEKRREHRAKVLVLDMDSNPLGTLTNSIGQNEYS